MAPRASWKGYLKLSLVSCPIALYPASSSSERVSFNRINKKTGTRLKQQNVDAETGEPVLTYWRKSPTGTWKLNQKASPKFLHSFCRPGRICQRP
jgi:hypothetical protein